MPPSSSAFVTKVKVQLKLAIARLRMVQKRDEAVAKTQRRQMAQLLDQGKTDSARIRVENIIRSDITTELYEILELYCELLLARAGLLEVSALGGGASCDPGLEEAVKSIMYAAPKTEIKELQQVRLLLADRFGKDFTMAAMENAEGKVSEKVVRKLSVTPPREELVQGYLEEIAKAYGVSWPPRTAQDLGDPPGLLSQQKYQDVGDDGGDDDDDDDDDENPSGRQAQKTPETPLATGSDGEKAVELSKATPPRTFGPNSPLHVNPPSPSTDNIRPKVTLNSVELRPSQKMVDAGLAKKKTVESKSGIEDGIPDINELAKRFAALKK